MEGGDQLLHFYEYVCHWNGKCEGTNGEDNSRSKRTPVAAAVGGHRVADALQPRTGFSGVHPRTHHLRSIRGTSLQVALSS